MRVRHAEVVGAGLVGLTAAAILARSGWSVTVHERSEELREVGAGLFLFRNALAALGEAGAREAVLDSGEHLRLWERFDERGRVIFHREFQDAGDPTSVPVVVERAKLHRALADSAGVAGAEILAGSKVVAAGGDGELRLADGTTRKADLVVAADGANSILRDGNGLLKSSTALGSGGMRFLVERGPEERAGHVYEYKNGARAIGVVPCGQKVYIYLESRSDDRLARGVSSDRESWEASFPHLGSVLGRLDESGHWAEFVRVRCSSWSAGRLVLLGDAAHAMPPHLSQGACLGMANARSLVHALARFGAVEEALAAWEESERPVTDLTQRWATAYARMSTRWPQPILGVRSLALRSLARSRFVGAQTMRAALHESPFIDRSVAAPDLSH